MKAATRKFTGSAAILAACLSSTRRQDAGAPSLRAFTLIEILLAVAIFSVVLAAMNGVFYGALRLRSKTAQAVEAALPIEQAVAIMKKDLQGLMAPGGTLAGPLQSGVSGADPTAGTTIYTGSGVINDSMPWGNIQKVTYSLRSPTNRMTASGSDLIRSVTRNLLATMEEYPDEQLILGDVEALQFSFYDGAEWRTAWDSTTESTVLPQAIKVELNLAATEQRRSRTPVQIVVPVTITASTNTTQSPTDSGGGQ